MDPASKQNKGGSPLREIYDEGMYFDDKIAPLIFVDRKQKISIQDRVRWV
ncbi:MAG: hypothetical protein Q4A75_07280 [Peptostreptococcaceae bacterium]|nr:hypothetical protein [Peptostreptococcaceae bacterium]